MSGSKEEARSFDVQRLDLKKASEVEVTEKRDLQLWRTQSEDIHRTWGHAKGISNSQLQIAKDNMNGNSINMVW
jgi:anti-sigma-K factor RskA